jgi:chromate transporter
MSDVVRRQVLGRQDYWQIWTVALYLGLTSFGGPAAHLGYFHAEYVRKKNWLSDAAYADLVALCQFLPGPASSQIGIAIGTCRGGILGGLIAWLGFTLPSVIMLLVAYYSMQAVGSAGEGWVHGLKLVAVPVVAQAVWTMGGKLASDRIRATIAAVATVLTLAWPTAGIQVFVIVLAGFAGLMIAPLQMTTDASERGEPIGKRAGVACLALFFLLLFALPLWRQFSDARWLAVFDSFYRSGSLVFGGGHVVLPLLEHEVVRTGWLTENQFLIGYGLAQAVPGPLFTLSAYLGATIGGAPLAILATLAVFLPSFLLVLGVLPFWNQIRRQSRCQAALWGINAAVVGLLLAALYDPVWRSAVKQPADFVIAMGCFVLLQFWKLPAWSVVVVSCGATLLLTLWRG